MPLQLRRGTTAERLSIVPLPGEPILDTDLNTIFIGNGTTAGGVSALTGITSEDAMDIVGQMFVNGQHEGIEFSYGSTQDVANRIDARLNLDNYDGEIRATAFRGSLFADDSTLLVNAGTGVINASAISGTFGGPIAASQMTAAIVTADNLFGNLTGDVKGSVFSDTSTLLINGIDGSINLDGTIKGDVIPAGNELYDLGSNSNRFKDLYLSGSSIFLGNATITSSGTTVNLPAGSTVGGVSIGSGGGGGDGVVDGSNYNINIVADDSTVLVNSFTKEFNGTFNGDVVGGNISGNIITNLISSSDSSNIICDTPFGFLTNVNIDGTLEVYDGMLLTANINRDIIDMAGSYENDQPLAIRIRRSRGSIASPTALQINDNISSIVFNAYDGNNYIAGGVIQARVTGTVSAGVTPTSLRFLISDNVGDTLEALRIDDAGSLRVFRTLSLTAPDGLSNYTNLRLTNHHSSGTEAANFALQRSRGTFDSPLTVLNGDPIYDLSFRAYDGSNYLVAANIRGVVDGAVSTGITPGRIDIGMRNSSGVFTTVSELSPVKSVFNSMLQLPTFADDTAADAAIGGAGNRVNGMMFYNTALNAVRAVVSGSWANL